MPVSCKLLKIVRRSELRGLLWDSIFIMERTSKPCSTPMIYVFLIVFMIVFSLNQIREKDSCIFLKL